MYALPIIIAVGPLVIDKLTYTQNLNSQWIVKYGSRSSMDVCIQEVMLRCMQVPSISTAGPVITELDLNRKT